MEYINQLFRYPIALTIAGSDSGGGAGIQADLKTFSSLGVFGTSAITAVTAQNTKEVKNIQAIEPETMKGQLDAVFEDFQVDAVKIGMLFNVDTVKIVAEALKQYNCKNVVLDPVMISTSRCKLIKDDAIEAIVKELFPLASVVTPNTDEAGFLTGMEVTDVSTMETAAAKLLAMGCHSVLMKGGHILGKTMTDLLFIKDGNTEEMLPTIRLVSPYINSRNTHGTGCTLSSAIAAFMAKGVSLEEAVCQAKEYISAAMENGADVMAGHGHGALNHFYSPVPLQKIRL